MARGFLATLQSQLRAAAREKERANRSAVREHDAAIRALQQAQRAEERAKKQLATATAAERRRLETEEREAHLEAMEAEVEARNSKLEEVYADIDSLLESTLSVDDYVDLDTLRVAANHPPFACSDLENPIPPPMRDPETPEPVFKAPSPPTGLSALFGKKKHAEAMERAQEAHAQALDEWRSQQQQRLDRHRQALARHSKAEEGRVAALAIERAKYKKESEAREAQAVEQNRKLDELIANLGYGTVEAVQEYISIVLSNSAYPEVLDVTHDFEFDPSSAELSVKVHISPPGSIREVKGYKYSKATDEIVETPLPQKVCRDRYAGAIHQVALRSLHEIFESDRRGIIRTITLEVGTTAVDPATGRNTYMPFVVVGADRNSFMEFDLSAVVPALALKKLGASVSKNPYSLVAVDVTGVRRS